MGIREAVCFVLCMMIVMSAGCVLPGNSGNSDSRESGKPGAAVTRLALSFGDDQPEEKATPAVSLLNTPAIRDKPEFHGSSSRKINGTGLAANASNSTSTLKKYLTDTSDDDNETAIILEKVFWNTVGSEIREKIDGGNSITRTFALAAVTHSGEYHAGQVCDLHDAVAPPVWTYVNDPADPDVAFWDYFAAASESITVGLKGDCDDYAILNAALVEAIGGESRVVYAVHPSTGEAHMYAEAQFADLSFTDTVKARYNVSAVSYRPGYWMNLDWQASNPGGPYYDDTGIIWVIYKDGTWEKLEETSSGYKTVLSGG